MYVLVIFFPQTFAWTSGGQWIVSSRVPFIVDVCKSTFEQLDELLGEVCVEMEGQSDWPPPQDKECLAVAGLNLLNLQVWIEGFFLGGLREGGLNRTQRILYFKTFMTARCVEFIEE